MKNKHAQIRMMETIAILFIFFVLLMMGFMFYIRIGKGSAIEKKEKLDELDSIRVSQLISFLPELQCSSKNIITDNCFDKYKLGAFEGLDPTEKDKVYYPFFYYSTMHIKQIYPDDPGNDDWVIYNKTGTGTSSKIFVPISLYDPVDKKYSFGVMDITYYPRT